MTPDMPMRILIVEDDKDDLYLLNTFLKTDQLRKTETFQAASLGQALETLDRERIDVILLDLGLPDSDGLDTVRSVYNKAPSVPIIVLSGIQDEVIAVEAVKIGAQDYLFKSKLDRSLLIRSIRYAGERKRALDQAREASEQARQVLSAITSILIRVNENGKVTHWNEVAEKTFSLAAKEVLGKPFSDCGIQWEKEKLLKMIDACLERRAPTHLEDITFLKKDGKYGVLGITINPIWRSDEKTQAGYLLFGADVTERRREEAERQKLEEHLRQAQRMESLGTLAGGIAHDFKNILGPILGYTEMMLRKVAWQSQERERLEKILKSAHRAKDLIDQILVFSRKGTEKKVVVSLTDVVDEAMKLLKEVLPATIEIETHLNPKASTILADQTHIHQVVMNLCVNAGYAMRNNGGKLTVSVDPIELSGEAAADKGVAPGNYVKLSVQDTGEGIPKKLLARIFEPFFTTKPVGKGSGMGLAAVHGIVTKHHGAIEVESEVGAGTKFQLYFPETKRSVEITKGLETDLETGTESILIVDDNPDLVDMMAEMLAPLGYQVDRTTNSEEALKMFRKDPSRYDLIVLDQVMPRVTGIKLATEIAHVRPKTPIILCTGDCDSSILDQAKELGIREFLIKPVSLSELTSAIRRVLNSSRLRNPS